MTLRQRLARHRKDNRLVFGAPLVILLILVALFYLIQRARDLPAGVANSRVILFALWYVDVALILAFLFVLGRNVYKLILERRILGSKFRVKLVATFLGLSLLPVLLLYVFATELLQGSIDRLFSTDVKQALEQGTRVVDAMNDRLERAARRDAQRVVREIAELELGDPSERRDLNDVLARMLEEQGDDYLAVYEDGQFVHAVLRPDTGLTELPESDQSFLREAMVKGHAVQIRDLPGESGRLILTAVEADRAGDLPPRIVVAGIFVDPLVATQSELFIRAWQGYRQLELQLGEIRATYLLTMLLVTLLILGAFVWAGLYLARRITVPIQALAEGTQAVRTGDLGYRVDVEADDELGVLVASFNDMTAEIQKNRETLDRTYEEQLVTNRELAEERALLAAVLENVAAAVISIDPSGRILTCNETALQLLGQREVDLIGHSIHEIWDSGELARLAALFAEADGNLRREIRLRLGEEIKTFEVKVTTMHAPDGEERGRVMVLEELTELIKAQQLAAWNEAARRIAHEIKNPLTPIQLSADRLLRKHQQGDEDLGTALEEAVAIIGREVETLRSMVDEFSRFARMPSPRPAPVEMGGIVGEVLQLYEGIKNGVRVSARVDPELPEVRLDPGQIRRVLINLLDNAIEATEAPGAVEIQVGSHDGTLLLRVADTGRGIDAEARAKLFLPHFSTKRRGSGLGLAIVHRIVTDHRGTIRVEENQPHGTVFDIVLPMG